MGEFCGLCWGEEKCILDFGREKLKERNHLADLGVDGRIILKWFVGK
jgi:hypothetical protein